MVGPVYSREVLSNIQRCRNWHELYSLIENNPIEYNVHFCLTKCNKSFINRDFICSLLFNNLLDTEQISIHYDYYHNDESNEPGRGNPAGIPGNRCFLNYIQYLGGCALRDGDMDAYNRFAGAWNAPVYVYRYRRHQVRNNV